MNNGYFQLYFSFVMANGQIFTCEYTYTIDRRCHINRGELIFSEAKYFIDGLEINPFFMPKGLEHIAEMMLNGEIDDRINYIRRFVATTE